MKPDLASKVRPMLYTDFTVPPELRCTLTKKEWASWCRRIIRCLKDKYGFCYGIASTHPTGEDLETFHPHLNVLWVQTTDSKPFLNVRALASEWQQIIGSRGRGVMWHNYSYQPGKQRHWLRYVLRPFPGWKHWRGRALRWYWLRGQLPKVDKPEPERCPTCGQAYAWFGLCQSEAAAVWWADSISSRRCAELDRGG